MLGLSLYAQSQALDCSHNHPLPGYTNYEMPAGPPRLWKLGEAHIQHPRACICSLVHRALNEDSYGLPQSNSRSLNEPFSSRRIFPHAIHPFLSLLVCSDRWSIAPLCSALSACDSSSDPTQPSPPYDVPVKFRPSAFPLLVVH